MEVVIGKKLKARINDPNYVEPPMRPPTIEYQAFFAEDYLVEIEREISVENMTSAINWIDNKYDNAYINAVNKFHDSIDDTTTISEQTELARNFRDTVVPLLKTYKDAHQNLDEMQEFLKGFD